MYKTNDFADLKNLVNTNEKRSFEFKKHKKAQKNNCIQIYVNNQPVITARFDKNENLCDIQPRTQKTSQILNNLSGRPYELISEELTIMLKDLANAEILQNSKPSK